MNAWQKPESISYMLDEAETWAVVGLSGDPSRTAYEIAEVLQAHGKKVVPIHPDAPTVPGDQGSATLADVRSEERRVGQECVGTCEVRCPPVNKQKKKKTQ